MYPPAGVIDIEFNVVSSASVLNVILNGLRAAAEEIEEISKIFRNFVPLKVLRQ